MVDTLSHYRREFPITEKGIFLSHSAVSPVSRRVTEALRTYAALVEAEPMHTYFVDLLKHQEELRQHLVNLINARAGQEIVLMPNTAMGLNTAAVSLPLQPGDNVLVLDGDYPANVYPWCNLAYRGVLTKFVPQHHGGLDLDTLVQRIDNRTRVIALSTAMFATGFRNDIAAVGQICHERGIYFVVDAIQTIGAFPMDVQAWHIDFLACGSQKWLLSTPGYGFLYCRRELLDELRPGAYVGASSVVDPLNYLDYNLTLQPTAERFNLGTPNLTGAVALHAAVGLLHEVGIERISQKILHLVDTLINDLSQRGYRFAASTAPEQRSGIVTVLIDNPDIVSQQMMQEGVFVTSRGAGLRIAPHFYNTVEDVLRVGELLETFGVAPL